MGAHTATLLRYAGFVTEGTVKNYVSGVLAKMGVRDRTRAVLKALERRLASRSTREKR